MTHSLAQQKPTAHLTPNDLRGSAKDVVFVLADTSLDPITLFQEAEFEPIEVALRCQQGLEVLEQGSQKQRRRYIAVGYKAAFYIYQSDDLLAKFDSLLIEQGILKRSNPEETRTRLIYYMMELMFHTAGLTTSNTAYRYAHGLFHYSNSGMSPDKVAAIIDERGPEQLYKDEVRRRQTDRAVANSFHDRHIDRLMRDGRYALEILGINATNAVEVASAERAAAEGEVPEPAADDDDPMLDDDDEEDVSPSFRRLEVTRRFEKMLAIATQLNGEIVESKAMLEDDPEDDKYDDGFLRLDDDERPSDNWKTEEVQLRYENLLKRAVRLNSDLLDLKALLEKHVE